MGRLDDPIADGLVGVAGVTEGLVEDKVHTSLDQDGIGTAHCENVDLMLPAILVPVGGGVAINVLV
jgi:hypothetical protein